DQPRDRPPVPGRRSAREVLTDERRRAAPRRELLPLWGQRSGDSRKRGGRTVSVSMTVPATKAASRSPSVLLLRKLVRRKVVLAGAVILSVVALLAIFAPWGTPHEPT